MISVTIGSRNRRTVRGISRYGGRGYCEARALLTRYCLCGSCRSASVLILIGDSRTCRFHIVHGVGCCTVTNIMRRGKALIHHRVGYIRIATVFKRITRHSRRIIFRLLRGGICRVHREGLGCRYLLTAFILIIDGTAHRITARSRSRYGKGRNKCYEHQYHCENS